MLRIRHLVMGGRMDYFAGGGMSGGGWTVINLLNVFAVTDGLPLSVLKMGLNKIE